MPLVKFPRRTLRKFPAKNSNSPWFRRLHAFPTLARALQSPGMAAIDPTDDSQLEVQTWQRPHGVLALLERAGREIVWLLIAVAFCVVEALVFLTDLPVAKF